MTGCFCLVCAHQEDTFEWLQLRLWHLAFTFSVKIFALLFNSWLLKQEGKFDFIKPTTDIYTVASPDKASTVPYTVFPLCWRSCHSLQICEEEAAVPQPLWAVLWTVSPVLACTCQVSPYETISILLWTLMVLSNLKFVFSKVQWKSWFASMIQKFITQGLKRSGNPMKCYTGTYPYMCIHTLISFSWKREFLLSPVLKRIHDIVKLITTFKN